MRKERVRERESKTDLLEVPLDPRETQDPRLLVLEEVVDLVLVGAVDVRPLQAIAKEEG